MRNTGTDTWTPARTRLGTTQPRDRASVVMGPGWLAPNRPAAIDRRVAPGETGRFTFTLRAPLEVGETSEYFNLVEEGVAWFSDPNLGGGPADNVIQVRVRTVPAATPDAGAMDAGGSPDVPAPQDVVRDEGLGEDVAEGDATDASDATNASDASDATDAPPSDAGEDVTPLQGGCACGVVAASPPRAASLLALLGVAAHRRRRRRPRDCEEV
jgi:MYXO-CTERM domain-containing protein